MPAISFQRRQDIAVRLTGGQSPKSIARTLGISLKSVYRLRKQLTTRIQKAVRLWTNQSD